MFEHKTKQWNMFQIVIKKKKAETTFWGVKNGANVDHVPVCLIETLASHKKNKIWLI